MEKKHIDCIRDSTVLVTGGAGFIGSHIVEKLVRIGAKVIVLDNFVTGTMDNLKFKLENNNIDNSLEVIEGDIRDMNLVMDITKNVDYVSHQAALRSVPKSVSNPLAYHEVDVTGTLNVLVAADKNKVKRVVFASSSSVYGEREIFPEKENDVLLPISPYACCKLAAENYCGLFTRCYGLETISLRYFNVFGPRQSLENKYAVVVPKFIISLLNKQPTPIFGDGKQARDFTYIDNVVDANLAAFVSKKGIGEVFNIACSCAVTVLGLSKTIQKLIGVKIGHNFLPPRPGDVNKTLADINKARENLGFEPKISLEEGLKETIEWFKTNKVNKT